jgi:hypothetical protein
MDFWMAVDAICYIGRPITNVVLNKIIATTPGEIFPFFDGTAIGSRRNTGIAIDTRVRFDE